MGRFSYGRYDGWDPYVPVGQKIKRGHAAAKKLAAKEKREPLPVTLEGRKIAKTFWALKWCENLERYRDISNRLPRGATYVRNGSVADLVIEPGVVRAIVAGSEAYTIEIKINTLDTVSWKSISEDCAQEIESLLDLLQGRFSDGVMQRLTQAEGGLFPHKDQIKMSCSCPDFADVCKHIAATFYGVAARLDQQPELLFKLRSVDHLELISQATTAANLDRAFGTTDSDLSHGDLSSIFGIELESTADPIPSASKKPLKRKVVPQKLRSKATIVSAPVVGTRKGRTSPTPVTPKPKKLSTPVPSINVKKSVKKASRKSAKTSSNHLPVAVPPTVSKRSKAKK